jgi:hypothetical protein
MSKETTGTTGVADRVMNLKVTSIIWCSESSFVPHVRAARTANEKTELIQNHRNQAESQCVYLLR